MAEFRHPGVSRRPSGDEHGPLMYPCAGETLDRRGFRLPNPISSLCDFPRLESEFAFATFSVFMFAQPFAPGRNRGYSEANRNVREHLKDVSRLV